MRLSTTKLAIFSFQKCNPKYFFKPRFCSMLPPKALPPNRSMLPHNTKNKDFGRTGYDKMFSKNSFFSIKSKISIKYPSPISRTW